MSPRTRPRGGIDLGGSNIQAVIVAGDGEVLGDERADTPPTGGPKAITAAMAATLTAAAEAAGYETDSLTGVGVGAPGQVDSAAGTLAQASNLSEWRAAYPLAQTLTDALGTRVVLGNDVQVATRAEAELGAGRPFESMLGVFWGSGVGGGIILDGADWLGRGAAGEIGHMVVKRGGRRCPCGNRGCMEAYAGRGAMETRARVEHQGGRKTVLFELMAEHGKPRLTSGIWERALDHGDELAEELMDEAIKALGAAIASAVNLLDIEAVILGGGLGIRFGERFGHKIHKRMKANLFDSANPPAFEVAELGDLGGATGAALLVRRPEPVSA